MSKASAYIINLQKTLDRPISQKEACETIHARIDEIDLKLHEADGLRAEKIELVSILRELGDETVRRKRATTQAPPIEIDDDSTKALELRKQICEALAEFGPLNNRELIQKLGGYQQESFFFRQIKMLGEQDIISKNEDRKLIPGTKWEERPQ